MAAPPSHKLIPGCGFAVDCFQARYASHHSIRAFFLSHAHSDHYQGLTAEWSRGPVYCSPVTARLVAHMLGVGSQWLRPLALDTPTTILDVEVTCVDANHCPGAVQFLFRLPDGRRFVHTGDMRFSPALLGSAALRGFVGCDALYLDTTYCSPRHAFPSQEESIEYVAGTIQRMLAEDDAERRGESGDEAARGVAGAGAGAGAPPRRRFRRLFLISTYVIGKERVLTAVAERCGMRLHVDERKLGVVHQLELPGGHDPHALFTTDAAATPVRVVPWGFLGETWPFFRPNFVNPEELRREAGADEVVGFVATGWLYEMRRQKFAVRAKGGCSVHLVPYSEHSSFDELQQYVRFLRPHQVVPTVGVDGEDGNRARDRMLKHFRLLVDETASKAKFLRAFQRASEATTEPAAPPQARSSSRALLPQQDGQASGADVEDGQAGGSDVVDGQAGGSDIVDLASDEGMEAAGDGTAGASWAPAAARQHPDLEQPAVGVPGGAAPSAGAGTGGAGPSEPGVQQLLAVLGEEATPQQARQLLAAAGGDLQAALNGYLDAQAAAAASGSGKGKATPAASPTPSVAVSAGRGATPGSKRPAATPASKGKGRGGGKKAKGIAAAAASPGQRSITAFFSQKQPQEEQQGQAQQQQQQHSQPLPPPAQQQQRGAGTAAGGAAAAASPGSLGDEGEEEAPALQAPPTAGRPAAASKPRLLLPPPPGRQASAGGQPPSGSGGGGGGGREAAVPLDAMALPLGAYDPVAHACWQAGEPVPYLHLARAFELMHGTTKRLRISDVLVNCFRSVLALGGAEELVRAAYLATGRVAPDHEGLELRVGAAVLSPAIAEVTGASRARLHDLYRQLGDVGDVFQALKQHQALLQRPAPLTVAAVFSTLLHLADERGAGSQKRRQRLVLSLLRACREQEPKFIARTLVGNLRTGANWRSVIPALARAVVLHMQGGKAPKAHLDQAASAATAAFHVCPDLRLLCDAMLAHPPEEWQQRCPLTPGMPIKPMLAKICEGLDDAATQLGGAPFLAEWKYDGMRAQLHVLPSGQVRIFSRNCEDHSGRFPDAAQQLVEAMQGGSTSVIVDAEIVAVDREHGNRLRAFQELATRKKVDVRLDDIAVSVCVHAFDLLYRDGASLTHLPLEQRRQQLAQALPNRQPGRCVLAQAARFAGASAHAVEVAEGVGQSAAAASTWRLAGPATAAGGSSAAAGGGNSAPDAMAGDGAQGALDDVPLAEQLQQALLEAFAAGTEGLMLKSLAAPYEPSRRSDHWVKVKRDYCEGLHDTLDLVVVGAWYGSGRKAGWYSPYLLACYDPDTETLQSVCRCMSGFSDEFYRDSRQRLVAIDAPKPYVSTGERPPVWFEPTEVWEIRGAELSISPMHTAAQGRVHSERGLGLRFPRFQRVRDDKGPEDATTADQLAAMYQAQTRKVETAEARLAGGRQRQLALPAAAAPAEGGDEGEEDEAASTDADEPVEHEPPGLAQWPV